MREGIAALGIHCGALHLAIPDGWGSMVVDEFEVTPIPLTPPWLLGMANVDGEVLPVLDLGRYLAPDEPPPPNRRERLLIARTAADGERVALRFTGLPQNLRAKRDPAPPAQLPPRLQPVFRGQLRGGDGQIYLEIDCAGVMNAMAAQV